MLIVYPKTTCFGWKNGTNNLGTSTSYPWINKTNSLWMLHLVFDERLAYTAVSSSACIDG
ncbi:hypothetical protein [Dictyobacter formicarum]|uniref:hypothetical protein n=1 Tax=Dictyobacter formicarum TaxID=2778368 RepID=UPI0019161650|nr:hypothetical protein [Dictyobacter formicarum]